MKRMTIVVWACSTEGCQNWYGSSSQQTLDLTEEANLESDMRHSAQTDAYRSTIVSNRGECPDCRTRGVRNEDGTPIQRTRVYAEIAVPAIQPKPSPAATAGNKRPAGIPG